MSITDAVSRVSAIQAELASIQTAFNPAAAQASSTTTGSTSSGTDSTSSDFASMLAQAQGVAGVSGASSTAGGSATLPASASTMLTSDQQQFASRLASDTGLDPSVVSAWLLAEESGGAAQSRQAQDNNDWLNIGYTDSGTYGSADSVWSNPVTAADATAGWLKGQSTIPGYGTASSGIQAILGTAGQSPASQVAAIQNSGWASSGYPDLPSLLAQVGG